MSIARVIRTHWVARLTVIIEIATITFRLAIIFLGGKRPRSFGEKIINSPGTLFKENMVSICRSENPRLLIAWTWNVENHKLTLSKIVK